MKKKLTAMTLACLIAACSVAGCSSSGSAESTQTEAASEEAADAKEETVTQEETADAAESEEAADETDPEGWVKGDDVYFHVPGKAGGGTDLYTRYLTQALSEVRPGVDFVVYDYDTSEVPMETVKSADPDGYNLVTCHGGAIIQYLTGASEVNIKDDLRVVGILNIGGPQIIITKPDSPYSSLEELAEYVKANPGEVTVGCLLGGTSQIFFTSFFDALVGDKDLVTYVQCAAETDKLTNIAAGAIYLSSCTIQNAKAYVDDGKLLALGALGPKSATLESMSEMVGAELDESFAPTTEQGLDISWDSNYYVMAPKDLPDAMAEAINKAICEAEVQESFIEGNNMMAAYTKACDLATSEEMLLAEWETQDALVDAMGLKVR